MWLCGVCVSAATFLAPPRSAWSSPRHLPILVPVLLTKLILSRTLRFSEELTLIAQDAGPSNNHGRGKTTRAERSARLQSPGPASTARTQRPLRSLLQAGPPAGWRCDAVRRRTNNMP